MLRSRGCHIEDAEPVVYSGIKVIPGPAIVLKPDFVCCPGELNIKFPTPGKVKISARSTLVVRGPGVTIESLDLDGCLVIDVDRGETAVVRDLKVRNDGWVQVPVSDSTDEVIAMRGFIIHRKDARYVEVHTKDGEVDNTDDDDTSVVKDVEYEVEGCVAADGSFCGVNFGASTKPGDDSGPSCAVM
jgi:UDP-sugar pyrophosphorylase